MPPAHHVFNPEPRAVVLRRRLVTIPRALAVLILLTVTMPVLVLGAAVVDAIRAASRRRPAMAIRLLAFAWVFFAAEVWGLVRFLATWMLSGFGADRRRLVATAWPIQAWWARTLLASVRRLFSLEIQVSGLEAATPGPIVAMFRHASIIDNLLPAVLLTDRLGLRMRWIIKQELLTLPGLDVGGNRLPNYFVDRESSDARAEIRRIRQLAEDLAQDEGVLIYPEGTRFTAERRERALSALESSRPELWERARKLRHVLPPRLGGTLVLLDAGYDVVMCSHAGLGGFAKLGDLWSGALVGRTVMVRFRRFAAKDVPKGRAARVDWLYDRWREIDEWVATALSPA